MKTTAVLINAALLMFFLNASAPVSGQSIGVSQIDTSSLLINQNVGLYVSLTDNQGKPVKNAEVNNFTVYESSDGKSYSPELNIESFNARANYESGINFFLLIDNSGSMYRVMRSRGKSLGKTKIQHAKNAVATFLGSITNSDDRVGIAAYNTYYHRLSGPVRDKSMIAQRLEDIAKPVGEEGFTEIYASIHDAVYDFKSMKGRKALIILSDGENRPYYSYMKKAHRDYGEKIFRYNEAIRYCQEEGISVFAINFGDPGEKKERRLKDIALETGGAIFDARDEGELKNVYSRIANQILNEYYIEYTATMEPADKKFVKVQYKSGGVKNEAARFYFSSTVFGLPMKGYSPLLIIPLLVALCIAWVLSRISFANTAQGASLEVINPGQTKAITKKITLTKGKTIIGGTARADMTIVGRTLPVKENHATIVFDNKKKSYTIVSDGLITVNNKPVKTRQLESGDVIDVGGATIVFNDEKED